VTQEQVQGRPRVPMEPLRQWAPEAADSGLALWRDEALED
jgi:hypothetical protein